MRLILILAGLAHHEGDFAAAAQEYKLRLRDAIAAVCALREYIDFVVCAHDDLLEARRAPPVRPVMGVCEQTRRTDRRIPASLKGGFLPGLFTPLLWHEEG